MQEANKVVGKWHLENGLDIDIYEQNGKYHGKIIALNDFNDGQKLDEKNPDKSLRNRSLLGIVLLKNLSYNVEKGIWEDGKMYAPHMGMTANLEIKKVASNTLTAVGSKLLFWHTEEWQRI
jgi:hypothetical protein